MLDQQTLDEVFGPEPETIDEETFYTLPPVERPPHPGREAAKQLQRLTGDTGWVADYLNLYGPVTEAPDEVIAMGGLVGIAAAVSPYLRLICGGMDIPLNLYVMAIGDSGVARKSTAMAILKKHIKRLDDMAVLSESVSPEGLQAYLAENHYATMFIDEYARLKAIGQKTYGSDLGPLMTELYSGHGYKSVTKKDGENLMPGQDMSYECVLNVYACTTEEWLNSTIGDILSGELSRYLIIHHGVSDKDIAIPRRPDRAQEDMLSLRLLELAASAKRGAEETGRNYARFDSQAEQYLTDWYIGWKNKLRDHPRRDTLGPLFARYDWIGRKLAVLLDLSETMDAENVVVTLPYMERALACIDYNLADYEERLENGMLADPVQGAAIKVQRYLADHKSATLLEIQQVIRMPMPEAERTMGWLAGSGIVRRHEQDGVLRYTLPPKDLHMD